MAKGQIFSFLFCLFLSSWSFSPRPSLLLQAVEDGNLDEVIRKARQRKRRRVYNPEEDEEEVKSYNSSTLPIAL